MTVSLEVLESLVSSVGNASSMLLKESSSSGLGSLEGSFGVEEREISKVFVTTLRLLGGRLLLFALDNLLVPVVGSVTVSLSTDRELLPTRRDSMPSTRLTSGETDSLLPRRPTLLLLLLRRKLMLTTRELLLLELRPVPTEELARRDSALLRLPMPSPLEDSRPLELPLLELTETSTGMSQRESRLDTCEHLLFTRGL
jgi:hypothetical protein